MTISCKPLFCNQGIGTITEKHFSSVFLFQEATYILYEALFLTNISEDKYTPASAKHYWILSIPFFSVTFLLRTRDPYKANTFQIIYWFLFLFSNNLLSFVIHSECGNVSIQSQNTCQSSRTWSLRWWYIDFNCK